MLQFDRQTTLLTDPSQASGNASWEAAYVRFETAAQEIRKFTRRLSKLGAAQWSREAEIVEVCCGRGNGLHALSRLGFTRLAGVDLSPSLTTQYTGPATMYVCDCRHLPFSDNSKDIVIFQGGLHHLKNFPEDLERALSETCRILRVNGLCVVVEPWLTPFLTFVHKVCANGLIRRVFSNIDALATMIDHERETYYQWLRQPETIARLFEQFFSTNFCSVKWGKYMYVGSKRSSGSLDR